MGRSGLRLAPRATNEKIASLQGMRVLVVEDNMVNQQVAKELLEGEGALVSLAENGQLGVAAVASASPPFDAVLMDLQMPVMDGYAATRAIRHDLGRVNLPIIAMTANAMASDREACLAAGMNDHVGKPFDLNHLVALLLVQTGRVNTTQGAAVYMRYDPSAPTNSTLSASLAGQASLDGFPGVDVESALQRMGGKAPLYARTLNAFLAELTTLPDQFDALLQAGQVVDAARLLHTLKGVAATVGASALAALAKAMEAQVKRVDLATDTAQLRADFRAAVSEATQLMGEVAVRFVAPTQSNGAGSAEPPADRSQALVDLAALRAALDEGDMTAMELHAQLRQVHAALGELAFEPLDRAMADLDFDLAAKHCKALADTLNPPH
jgi:two-component system, sensor histidine kinase and response regulator